MHEIDLKNYSPHTDLIMDQVKDKGLIHKTKKIGKVTVETIIVNKENVFNDQEGTYITLSFNDITDKDNFIEVKNILVKELKQFLLNLNITFNMKCLVIGLGNKKSTPDALGPLTCDNLIITGHLFALSKDIDKSYREVTSMVPGVMGTTGIETQDIIEGIVQKTKPDFLIVVDSLASTSIERVNKTIQITDTGIKPGSGVLNKRKELSQKTLGIPLISIGIPTVVDAVTIVSDTIRYMLNKFSYSKDNINKEKTKFFKLDQANYLTHKEHLSKEDKQKLLGIIGTLNEEDKKSLIKEVLSPIGYNLMVTPKEIDFLIEKLGLLLGKSLNEALHNIKE